jgi:periplasmic divalent cation tolerance protein
MYIVILITVPAKTEARRIARGLLAKKLAACVNIVDGVASLFWWQAKIDRARESLLVVKSTKAKFARLVKAVRAMHSYTVPEIIALPVIAGNRAYLEWIDESLR